MPPVVLDDVKSLKEYIGREIGVTDWLILTHERIKQFAEATEDHQCMHLDGERASKDSRYGTTIAHVFLTLSLSRELFRERGDTNSRRSADGGELRTQSCASLPPFAVTRRFGRVSPFWR